MFQMMWESDHKISPVSLLQIGGGGGGGGGGTADNSEIIFLISMKTYVVTPH